MEIERAKRRVRALLAKADSTSFPAEEAELRRKANELVDRYGLVPTDLVEPRRQRPAPTPQPCRVVFTFRFSGSGNYWANGTTTSTTGSYYRVG